MKHPSPFHRLVKEYDAVRPKYPHKVFTALRSVLKASKSFMLDLGCGTGISTRQIAQAFKDSFVVGCDKDPAMLEAALGHQEQNNVAYIQGNAHALPFENNTFDTVMAFTAFHWFSDPISVHEIKRVLKTNGFLCIVHPRHLSPFTRDFRGILERELKRPVPPSYRGEDFRTTLELEGLDIVAEQKVKAIDTYTLEQYLTLLRSYSLWAQVPTSKRKKMLDILKGYLTPHLQEGYIHDEREIQVMIAKRKTRAR